VAQENHHVPRMLWCLPEAFVDAPALRPRLERFASVDVRRPAQAELASIVRYYDILVPRLSHEVNESMLDSAPSLKLIGTPSTGSDHIAVAAAKRRGIETVTLKDDRAFLDSIQATAELAWLLILACHRRFREALDQVERGQWNAQDVRGHELMGRTLGIVGYGRLGTMVARFAQAFCMRVIATDPFVTIRDPGVKQLPLEQLLVEADIISLHVHLSDSTRGLIGPREFTLMKHGAVLVNTSRGSVINEEALLKALREGKLAAAGLDVIQGERSTDRASRPLLAYAANHRNLIITPHIGGFTQESQIKAHGRFVELLEQAWAQRAGPAHLTP